MGERGSRSLSRRVGGSGVTRGKGGEGWVLDTHGGCQVGSRTRWSPVQTNAWAEDKPLRVGWWK